MTLARRLRNAATPEERALWHALSRFRPPFTRQHPIGPFVADLACHRARIVVELDGSQHVDSAPDARRTAMLETDGWHVLRFWNAEVRENIAGVVTVIADAVAQRLPADEPVEFIASRAGRTRRPRTRGGEGAVQDR